MSIHLNLIDFVQNHLQEEKDDALSNQEAIESQEPDDLGFESDVSRATHSGLLMRPIYELEARRFGQGNGEEAEVWEAVDLMWTAFAVLDVISELTEYQIGATRSQVLKKILPLVRSQVTACSLDFPDEVLQGVINKVFDHLTNRTNRYLPFSYTYFDGATGGYLSRRFWLIKTVYSNEGKEALFTLTDEGYAAYFGLHETSALDAAAIGNLRIKLLLERGNLDDAISVAEGNNKQCSRKAQEVHTVRRLIRRNIKAVDYKHVQKLAEEGVNQAMDIQKESSKLHNLVIENMLHSQTKKHSLKLHKLAEKLETLNHELMKLAGELQDLPEDYQQFSHKLFRRRPTGAFPSMDEVMGRILRLEEQQAAQIGKEFIARIDPPAKKALFDPASVIEACDRALERLQTTDDHHQKILEVDGEAMSRFVPELNEELMQNAFEMLYKRVGKEREVQMSDLLTEAGQFSEDELFPAATAMGVFQCLVDRRIAEKHSLKVQLPDPNSRVAIDIGAGRRYHGHELTLKYRSALSQIPNRKSSSPDFP
ncbi:hypothetical protein [Desulfogranum japonicum]|uniref:hypothetical protein n=1 Tax=Desulfogranum japonicum TaxID=231447 RepID=UPI0004154A15|nr:hypothetical protein [Desulfogranum japonicum]